jgi:hypothetical protein
MRGSAFLTTDTGEPTFDGEGTHEAEYANKTSKRRRAPTKTGSGPNRKQKMDIDSRPCAACGFPFHSLKQCWLAVGAPEGKVIPEKRKIEFEKKKTNDSNFARLVGEVLKLREEEND